MVVQQGKRFHLCVLLETVMLKQVQVTKLTGLRVYVITILSTLPAVHMHPVTSTVFYMLDTFHMYVYEGTRCIHRYFLLRLKEWRLVFPWS